MTTPESRKTWGARAPKSTEYLGSTKGVKAHYTGGRVDPATLTDHAKCRAAIRGIQNGHMDGNGWADIGYSMWVCNHAYGIGRGPHVLPAANGAGLNSGHYAILTLVGDAGVTKMTDAMKRNFHEARNYLRDKGNAGPEIKGHRDGYSTDCPGPDIYAWVRAGAPKPATSTPQEEDMPLNSDDLKKIGDTVFTAVWMRDVVDVSARDSKNPDRMPISLIQEIWSRADAANANVKTLLVQSDAQNATIKQLVTALADRDDAIDVDALMGRIESAIEGITVRLDVPDGTA